MKNNSKEFLAALGVESTGSCDVISEMIYDGCEAE